MTDHQAKRIEVLLELISFQLRESYTIQALGLASRAEGEQRKDAVAARHSSWRQV
jgi:hypothetical protein